MALKLSLLLQAVDRISAPVRRVQERVQRMGEGVERAARKVDRAGGRMDRFGGKAQALRNKLLGVLVAANRAGGPNGLDLFGKASDKAGYAVGRLLGKMGGLALGLGKLAGTAAVGAGGFAIFDMFQTAAQFEDFEIMLTNLEGSSDKAKASMAWVQKFAADTPYSLEEVMEAFVQLKAYGIDPMGGALIALGDTAAGMNKRLMDAVEALADAETGEFERLKSFAIRTKVEGDKVTFSYQKNGKAIEAVAKNQSAAIREVLIEVMGGKFLGMMEQKSKGFNGLIRNMGDKWTQFLNMVAAAGVFDKVKGRLEEILARVEQMAADGRLEEWAQRIGDKLERAFDWAWRFTTETDWQAVADGMLAIVGVLGQIISMIGRAAGAWSRWQADVQRKQLENIRDGWFTSEQDRAGAERGLAELDRRQGRGRAAPAPAARPKAGGWLDKMGRPGSVRPALPRPQAQADKVQVGGQAKLVIDVRGQGSARLTEFSKKGDVPWSIQIARSNWVPA